MTEADLQKRENGNIRTFRLGLAKQLIALALIPTLIAIGFMTVLLVLELQSRKQAKSVSNIASYMVKASHLVHELQKERGASAGYIASGGKSMANEMIAQRILTDKHFILLRDHLVPLDLSQYGQRFTSRLTASLQELVKLASVREKIKSLSLSKDQSLSFYTRIINYIIGSFQEANITIRNSELSFPFTACINLVMAIEMSGIERAIMTSIAAEDKPVTTTILHEWMRVSKGQEALCSAFEHQVSGAILKGFDSVSNDAGTKAVDNIRKQITGKLWVGKFGLKPEDVFAVATKRIDELIKIEDMQTNEILRIAEKRSGPLIIYVVLFIVTVLLMCFLSFQVTRNITRPLEILSGGVQRVAGGELDHKIEIRSQNEIGVLADNFNSMLHNLRTMKEKDDINNWLKTGQAELNARMQGVHFERLGPSIISYLASYLNAQIGVIYIVDDDNILKLTGSYAYTNSEDGAKEFKFGEGLAGQAAQEKRTILMTNVPDDYIKVSTGWGEAVPRNILVVPFVYKGIVKGVIELGACNKFTDVQLDFLNMVTENIATVFDLEQSRLGMREVIAKTSDES